MRSRNVLLLTASLVLSTSMHGALFAQGNSFMRLFRPHHQVTLAQLDSVQQALKLTDDQKKTATNLNDSLNADRMSLFQDAAGDFDAIEEGMPKLNRKFAEEFNKVLDQSQQQRIQEIYVQANGPTALFDDTVAKAVKLTPEQSAKLQEARDQNRDDMMSGGLQDLRTMSPEEGEKLIDDLIAKQDARLNAVLTEEQRAGLDKLKGETIKVNIADLPSPFGR